MRYRQRMPPAPHSLPAAALIAATALLLGCPQEPCPTGETRCKGLCVDTLTDANNCGGCEQPCGLGSCSAGTCACDTAAGATECAGMWPRCANLASDPAHCGACGTSCVQSTGATCASGACACPATAPYSCGTTVESCCEASKCCGDVCAVKHSNGLGGNYFSCDPLGTYSLASATLAADSWNSSATKLTVAGCAGACIARQTANSCAIWCYSDSIAGQALWNTVGVNCQLCPPEGNVTGTWN
ncbi:MAG: hypothetical protein WCC48_04295 [Anaeromyxobacteraceae bacterium]